MTRDVMVDNEFLKMSIDKSNGSILQLESKITGAKLIAQKELAENWRLTIPYDGDDSYLVSSKNQRCSEIQVCANEISLRYEGIHIDGKLLNICVSETLCLRGDELQGRIRIENNDTFAIDHVWFPIIGGVHTLLPRSRDKLIIPSWNGTILNDPFLSEFMDSSNRYYHKKEHLMYAYPKDILMQWIELYNDKVGLFLSSYDNEKFWSIFILEREGQGEGMTFIIVASPFIVPGKRWESPLRVCSLHSGDWHVGADKYRKWCQSWMERRWKPGWIKNFNGWLAIQTHTADGHIYFSYEDFLRVYQSAAKVGLNTIHLHSGVHRGGIEGDYPSWNIYSERMGGKETLVKSINKIKRLGGHIVTFAKDNKVNAGHKDYEQIYSKMEVRMRDGSVARIAYPSSSIDGRINLMQLANMCRASKEWQKTIVQEMRKLAGLGLDGIMLDEWASGIVYCFSKEHGHNDPVDPARGQLQLGKMIREECDKVNPNFMLAGEEIWDAAFQYLDLSFARGSFDITEEYNSGAFQIMKYTFPYFIRTLEVHNVNLPCPFSAIARVNIAFAYGMVFSVCIDSYRGTLDDCPEFANYLKEVIKIRKYLRRYFGEGIFRDTLEAKIVTQSKNINYATYKKGNDKLIIVWNTDQKKNLTIPISVEIKPKSVRIYSPFQKIITYPQVKVSGPFEMKVEVPADRFVALELLSKV